MILIQSKLSDIEVIQRVFDYWDPLGRSSFIDWLGGDEGLNEYDHFAPAIKDCLRSGHFSLLQEHLTHLQFEVLNQIQIPKRVAKIKYVTWCFFNVWENQQKSGSNLRLKKPLFFNLENQRSVSDLEVIQLFLESIEPKGIFDAWLWGEDTLKDLDSIALLLWQALQKELSSESVMNILVGTFPQIYPEDLDYWAHCLVARLRKMQEGPLYRYTN